MKTILPLLAALTLTACTTTPQAHPSYPYRSNPFNNETFTAQEFKMDMPRTFESGSCIASGGTLLLRRPQMIWYCKHDMIVGHYTLEELK